MGDIKNINISQTGMSSKHPSSLKENEYIFALNANIQTDITSPVIITNEHSNLLCLQDKFNDGFKVIGEYYAPEINLTFLFFSNIDGRSEIGYMTECQYNSITDLPQDNPCDNCDTVNVEQVEDLVTPCCQYFCISKDSCLNFNIDFPIRKIVYKKDYCGHALYFTDFNNPIRCLKLNLEFKLDNSVREIKNYTAECNDVPTIGESCEELNAQGCVCCQPNYYPLCSDDDYVAGQPDLNCEKIKLFPNTDHLHIKGKSIDFGGNLSSGTYQLAACYANGNGEKATRTFTVSNPVSVFSNNKITSEINYPTSQVIKFEISNIDTNIFKYINLYAIRTIGGSSTVRNLGVFDITSLNSIVWQYVLSNFELGKDSTIDEILEVFPVYDKAQEITTVSNTLLLGNLVSPKDLNLQQAINGLSKSVRWGTLETEEDFYNNGINAGNSRSFLRDETYPIGIVLERNNTLDTCAYPLIGREKNEVIAAIEDGGSCSSSFQTLLGGNWVSDLGNSIVDYKGEWIPTANYYSRVVNDRAYDVVSYNGDYYIASVDISSGNTPPDINANWVKITLPTSCYLPVDDDEIINNNDVFEPINCDGSTDNDHRWRVYNTGYNLGKTGSPTTTQIVCEDVIEEILCSSYTYSVPTLKASWVDSSGTVTFISDTNAEQLLIAIGSSVSSECFPDATGIVVSGFDASGNVIADIVDPLVGNTDCLLSFFISCDDASGCAVTYCSPGDCYISEEDKCTPCADNYPTDINDIIHCSDCTCPVFPPVISPGCNPGFVRTKTDALSYLNINGSNLLCIDNLLLQQDSTLIDPFIVKLESTPIKIVESGSHSYYVYNILNIQETTQNAKDPTPKGSGNLGQNLDTQTMDPADINCLSQLKTVQNSNIQLQNYLFPFLNMPSQDPSNYSPTTGVTQWIVSPENKCNDYGPNAPVLYMLGDALQPSPISPFCCDDPSGNCHFPANGDYWGINETYVPEPGTSEVHNEKYGSYWYSFIASSLQSTVVIKSKIGYKFGEFTNIFHTPDSTTVGSKDYQEQGDFRIDVYEGLPSGVPKWSTGLDALQPATYYYSGAYEDIGTLIIGDVANSSGLPTTAGQIPLIAGNTYYVHIYMLPQGNAKLNKPVVLNQLVLGQCGTQYGPDEDENYPFNCCSCFFANYGYMNLCMNSMTSEQTKTVFLPETWQVQCKYEFHYREQKVLQNNCDAQVFEYGAFAFWESDTLTYPNNPNIWGDLCGKKIRHFKFPDCLVTPVQDQDPLMVYSGGVLQSVSNNTGRTAKIYPIGIKLDPQLVSAWLDLAALPVSQGGLELISQEERNQITGYKIVRGNRAGFKSIIGKGLLYDQWKYNYIDPSNVGVNTKFLYPSYPFNDFRTDRYLNKSHPYQSASNNNFSFLSPEYTFNSPNIGNELKIEAVNYGSGIGNFYTVLNHPKYTLLSSGGIALAATLAGLQLAADLLILIGEVMGPDWQAGLSTSYPVGAIIGAVGAGLSSVPKFFIYAQQWRDLILNFGVPQNFAKYFVGLGNYHSSGLEGRVFNIGNKRRSVTNDSQYLLGGNYQKPNYAINNYLREDSIFLNVNTNFNYTGTALKSAILSDSSRFILSDDYDFKACLSDNRQFRVASYYASLKNSVFNQYGTLQDINWLFTGYASDFKDLSPTVILGGDTFIGRMTQKRKLPFFLTNTVGASTGVDSQYQRISNITNATYFFNSVGTSTLNSSSIQFKTVEHKFDCEDSGGLYLNGIFYLFSYGIVSFICESDVNLNYRYSPDNIFHAFYPQQSDLQSWTQEYKIPIETPNSYFYNTDYSKQNREAFFCNQPVNQIFDECWTTYNNRVINSLPDNEADFYSDPWRVFLANDYKDFPLTNGDLIGIDGIEKEKLLLRFSKTSNIMNAYYTMQTNTGVAQIGTGSLWAQKPLEFSRGGVGYAGSQHHAFATCQFGHFWVDAKRSAIFMLPIGDGGLVEISQSFNSWFNNNLPFNILKDFPSLNVDNNYKDFGITLGWDNRFDRLFVTKRDFEVQREYKGQVLFNGVNFTYKGQVIKLSDSTYFCNKSWTISYSPILKSWISYYSFVPNFYIAYENYFQTGINYSQDNDNTELGIWNHLMTNKSFQVFYGKLYPYITDVVVKEQLINKQLQSIEYQADFLRFQNDFDYFYNPAVTFNKVVIWSENQNSGNVNLVVQNLNNLSQALLYPKVNTDSTDILVTRKENNWRLNQFWDLVRNKYGNVPPMILGCHPYLKEVNPDAIQYNKPALQKTRMSSDYFTLRFINDTTSLFKILNKWFISDSIKSYS